MSLPGPRRHLGLLVATTVLVGAATGAAGETSADGDRAGSAGGQGQVGLLVLTSDPDSRAFLGAFLAAHLGQVLESEGIALRPWRASAARLMDRGEGFACSASDDCVRSVARALAAPALVFAETRSLGRRRVRLRGRVVRVTEATVTRGTPVEATGTETRIARALEGAVRGLVEGPLPCTIHLRPDEDLSPDHLQVAWDDEPDGAFLSPVFLEPGAHRVEARAPGREASALEVTCEAGRVYALDLR